VVHPKVESFSVPADNAAREHRDREACALCSDPHQLHVFLEDLLDVLHEQARDIERLTVHVERHTDRLLQPSEMHVLASRLSDLRARLHAETSTA
jgi:hypothetical protein